MSDNLVRDFDSSVELLRKFRICLELCYNIVSLILLLNRVCQLSESPDVSISQFTVLRDNTLNLLDCSLLFLFSLHILLKAKRTSKGGYSSWNVDYIHAASS